MKMDSLDSLTYGGVRGRENLFNFPSYSIISLITMVEVPEIMIHYPYIRILSRYAIREKVTAGGK